MTTSETVSLAGTGHLLSTGKLQESIDKLATYVDKLEGLVVKAQKGLSPPQGTLTQDAPLTSGHGFVSSLPQQFSPTAHDAAATGGKTTSIAGTNVPSGPGSYKLGSISVPRQVVGGVLGGA